MARFFSRLSRRSTSRVSSEALTDNSSSRQPDTRADMVFSVPELSADNSVGNTTLYDTDQTAEKDEWLGGLHIGEALALLLLRRVSNSESIASLMESLRQEHEAFQYDHLYHQLRLKGVRLYRLSEQRFFQGDINFKKECLGWIGAIRRRGTLQEQHVLEGAIHDTFRMYCMVPISQSNNASAVHTVAAVQAEPSDEDSDSTDTGVEMWKYTTTLQDKFLGKSLAPLYRVLEIQKHPDPPLWESTITYRGTTLSAMAGNRKLAKHRSSKKLCDHLEITVA
ncbi:hypothetical protein PV08_07345 [Exophiala spinifera]|uniref:DRBM domain-containing protein n=1 Tax=Exophiala spinifera TaxID=91928 RepID=A0A0D1YI22_9EURO|nr:uncharacterized protein PV08_07345 [Exophiala spinifera]KIW14561.1 hypothetical protein PV08_07345 [Exophiala spinifera]